MLRRPIAPFPRRRRPAHRVPVLPWYARPGLLVGLLATVVTALLVALVAWLMVPRTAPAADRPGARGTAPTPPVTTSTSGAGSAEPAPLTKAAASSTSGPEPTTAPSAAPTRASARETTRAAASTSPSAPLPASPTTALPTLTLHDHGSGRPTDKPSHGNAGGRTP